MYSHLTDRACRVLLEMRTEAFILDHGHTGTEHLLIATVEADGSISGPVLRRFDLTVERVRREVQLLVTPGIDLDRQRTRIVIKAPGPDGETLEPETPVDSVTSPREFTPSLMKCLMRLAPFEAKEVGNDHVGPEHLLLALLRAGDGVAVQALRNLGAEPGDLTRALYEKIAEDPAAADSTAPEPSEEERRAALEMQRVRANSRMRPEDRVVFTSDDATRVFCVLDGVTRLYDSPHHADVVEAITRSLTESFTRRAGNPSQSTPAPFTPDQERRILRSILEGLRREAADQLGD
jgi:ATP-dependent Clp protease ATP-binding subunit ClpA